MTQYPPPSIGCRLKKWKNRIQYHMLERMIEKEITNHFDGLQIRQHSDLHGINFTILHGEQLTLQSLLWAGHGNDSAGDRSEP